MTTTTTTMTPRELVLKVFELGDSTDLDAMAARMTPDIDFLNPFGPLSGRDAIVSTFEARAIAFPDSAHVIQAVYAQGDVVTLEGEWTGTNSGPLPTPGGVVNTGRSVRFPFSAVCRVEGGLVSVVHVYHDLLIMFSQLGLMDFGLPVGALS